METVDGIIVVGKGCRVVVEEEGHEEGERSMVAVGQAAIFDRMFEDPLCEGSPEWSQYRSVLSDPAISSTNKTSESMRFYEALSSRGKSLLDHEYPCLLGAIANTYYRLLMALEDPSYSAGRVVDMYVNELVDNGIGNAYYTVFDKPEWGLTEGSFKALRRSMSDFGSRRREPVEEGLRPIAQPSWEPSPSEVLIPARSNGVKVFVYSDGSEGRDWLTSGAEFCRHNQWGMDVTLHDFYTTSGYSTLDPQQADYFLVPGWPACHYYMRLPDDCQNRTTEAYEDAVATLPYFNRTSGRDHLFPIYFADYFQSFREKIPDSPILTPETEIAWERSVQDFPPEERQNAFNSHKDIAIPPLLEPSRIVPFATAARGLHEREIFASFAGKAWSDIREAYTVRRKMREAFSAHNDTVILVEESMRDLLSQDDMARLLGNSVFCLVPRGRVAWTVRLYEILWADCIPVILSDFLELPFEQLFDVTQATIKWPQDDVENLYRYLKTIPKDTIEGYRAAGRALRCWYTYPPGDLYWLANPAVRDSLIFLEALCPNLSTSRNAMVAVAEILKRRRRATRTGRRSFWHK
ncbi:hypothetical protein FOZ63_025406 [Perkinsus olseni]|uniref:Exostosin GT47 domain-containing protein n=2 Tax=Perkinsus olseni TaxID=32597 RepID=A0A7J6QH19_PEROL|nr:hypothetical protein FOZ63_025406 [Perkinsus olseni]